MQCNMYTLHNGILFPEESRITQKFTERLSGNSVSSTLHYSQINFMYSIYVWPASYL